MRDKNREEVHKILKNQSNMKKIVFHNLDEVYFIKF